MKVIVFGASGETGRSIVKGLLESTTQFVSLLLRIQIQLGGSPRRGLIRRIRS